VFGPILGLAFVLLGLEARRSPIPVRRVMLAGLGALLVAIAMEAATPILFALGFDHGTVPYELESVVEEGLELAGVVLLATGLAALVVEALRGPTDDRDSGPG
jgi:multisubunit Na+/H+ antiporter MnhB subunit